MNPSPAPHLAATLDDLDLGAAGVTEADGTFLVDPHGPSLYFLVERERGRWIEGRVDRQNSITFRLRPLRATRSTLRLFVMAKFDGWRCRTNRIGIPTEYHSLISGLAHMASLSRDPKTGLILTSASHGFWRTPHPDSIAGEWVQDSAAATRFSVQQAASATLPSVPEDDVVYRTADLID